MDNKFPELQKVLDEMESYEKKIFEFDHAENDFLPIRNPNTTPKEEGIYLTIRCGLSGIYTVLNEWKNGEWQMKVLDGSTTIAYSRNKIKLKCMKNEENC